jgi:all-trans-retinol 13,14-reductase
VIQSFKQNPKLDSEYDAIVIGSGMGGLTTGALLAKEGKKVLILERHYTAGGFTHIFKRPGYEWDVGIHYVGEMGKKTSFSRRMSDYITNDKLQWADMGEVYDRIVVGEEIFDFPKRVGNLKERLKAYFPDDSKAIDKYFELVFAAVKSNRGYFMAKALPKPISALIGGWLNRKMLKYSRRTTLEVLEGITSNPKLIKVLTAQYGDYGLPPAQSSFAMHALLVKHYFNGGYFPIGGSSQIVKTIDQVIEGSGGTIITNAEVEEVIITDGRASGVRMADGTELTGKKIISNAGVYNTAKKLLPSDLPLTKRLLGLVHEVAPSSAHICLYVGLDGTPEELKLPKANYWIYPENGSHDENIEDFSNDINKELPLVYISFPSSKDPDWQTRYPDKSTIDILTVMPYDKFEQWEGTDWKKRPEEYETLKENLALRLLDKLYELEPQTKGKVAYYELSSPLTTKKFVNYERGEIYGLEHSPRRFDSKLLKPATSLKNFYLTGQDISTAGIVGAMASGLLTASVISGKNLMKKVLKT